MKTRHLAFAALLLASAAASSGAQARPTSRVFVRTGILRVNRQNTLTLLSFRARRGQKISARVTSKTFAPLLFITSPSGRNLIEGKKTSYSACLSETGRYRVRVGVNYMATGAQGGTYRLQVRLR